jgi:hypothetical protein
VIPAAAAALLVMMLAAGGCEPVPLRDGLSADSLAARERRLAEALARPDTGGGPLARWVLPAALSEISGLALTGDGRLLAHADETARLYELDYRRGVVLKRFTVGAPLLRADLEGITRAGDRLFLIASNGRLYEFREVADGGSAGYREHDTRLGKECEFEGVAWDSVRSALLLPCKNVGQRSLRDMLVIYRWSLTDSSARRLTRLAVPLDRILAGRSWKRFQPTDIAVDPATGNYVMVAAPQRALLVITPDGALVQARGLPEGHAQPEGVAITRDGILIVSDEAVSGPAAITLYRWP